MKSSMTKSLETTGSRDFGYQKIVKVSNKDKLLSKNDSRNMPDSF